MRCTGGGGWIQIYQSKTQKYCVATAKLPRNSPRPREMGPLRKFKPKNSIT
jgi:hypothetical protein